MEQKPVEANLPVVNATEKKHTNRGLIALLCVIGVIIVGLVVAIVVVRMKGEDENGAGNLIAETDLASEMYNEAQALFENDLFDTDENVMAYFDAKLNEYPNQAFLVDSTRVTWLIDKYFFDQCLPYLEKYNADDLDLLDRYTLYSNYNAVYDAIGDSEKAAQYSTLMQETSVEINKEMFGA